MLHDLHDHVDHNVLTCSLMMLLPDASVQWICSFLLHRRQRVKIRDILTDWPLVCRKALTWHHPDRPIVAGLFDS